MTHDFTEITTLAQLDELPAGSAILAQFPAGVGEKHPDGKSWWFAGSHICYRSETVPLPARLLWIPEWEKA